MSVKDSRIAPNVICPFYVDDVGVRIRCEGIDTSLYTHRIFRDVASKKEFMERNCCKYKRGCFIALAIEKKYE